MAVKIFAAVVIGSAETEMRIYELTPRKNMKEVDCISTRISLGVDAYNEGSLDPEKIKDLCNVLKDFKRIMDGYHVDGFSVCATSALREISTSLITRDYIEKQTGLPIRIISNSEQRFLDYKSIACIGDPFEKIIQNGTAIVDIGGNSIQISVFDNDKLFTTQNIRMGRISTMEKYLPVAKNRRHFEAIVRELMTHELNGFGKLYQKERDIQNLVIVDNDLQELMRHHYNLIFKMPDKPSPDFVHITTHQFNELYSRMMDLKYDDIAQQFQLSAETVLLVIQSMIFCKCLLEQTGAQVLWLMDVSICGGLCYDYGVSAKLIRTTHDFEEDILAASRNIAKRYKSNQAHIRHMEYLCTEIFNKTRKIHGMKQRERLLLQIAAILHNCGKFISLTNVSECAYNIIMATEIIGLSHYERSIIANVVKYNTTGFTYFRENDLSMEMTTDEYLLIAKLTAILRIANALDRGHRQKCRDAVITVKDDQMIVSVETQEDLTLEKVTLEERASFFEEVFNLHPVIRQKKK